MENEIWSEKYQQSGLERQEDSLNNGNAKEDGETVSKAGEDAESVVKIEKEQDPVPTADITISEKGKKTIQLIQEHIKTLSPIEKFLLFLKLPSEITNAVDPFRQPLNPLGSRSEIYKTISWIKTHLEEDPDISLPKQEVYNEYSNYCETNGIKALSQADFGKVMKQVYPNVRARRLGTRGNSRYCYSGLRRCVMLKAPLLPDLADKPMSTEAPFTQPKLLSAAWLIVKSWSEQQLGLAFPTIQSLAYHILSNFSIGSGTEAATIIASALSESVSKGEEAQSKAGNKHREMQLQLQRKIQQKNEGKERKRKMQSPKSEQQSKAAASGKKTCRSQSVPAPSTSTSPSQAHVSTSGECSTASSGSASPVSTAAARPICDKTSPMSATTTTLEFARLTALPDFNSFQRPAQQPQQSNTADTLLGQEPSSVGQLAPLPLKKVPIPRLAPAPTKLPAASGNPKQQQAKYKSLQPRQQQQQCDITPFDQRQDRVEGHNRSQLTLDDRINKETTEEREVHNVVDMDEDVDDFPLTRERLDSVSNVEKDAMDEYLGTNNSQHEEELSKYFSNNNVTTSDQVESDTSKLSTLRQLLEQNGIVENKPVIIPPLLEQKTVTDRITFTNVDFDKTLIKSEVRYTTTPLTNHVVLPSLPTNTKRRVSFETPAVEDTVPASPNTRRKNFSFTPISPGPQSPNGGIQSKCSSTTASPFVSPRNTPVLRTKPSSILKTTENRKPASIKVKKELNMELPNDQLAATSRLPVSEPVSPMLQKLLKSGSKVCYDPAYTDGAMATEVTATQQFFATGAQLQAGIDSNRSQSVPLHQMLAAVPPLPLFLAQVPSASATSSHEFSELEPTIPSENVKRLLHTLDESVATDQQQCADNNNIDLFSLDVSAANEFGIQLIDGNMAVEEFTHHSEDAQLNHGSYVGARIGRSQSMDVGTGYEGKCMAPSRSVPGTPLPIGSGVKEPVKLTFTNSRSYPSTPLTAEDNTFTYNIVNSDCLLNGQPIRADDINCSMPIFGDREVEHHLTPPQKEFVLLDGHDFTSENGIDDCVTLMGQSFGTGIN